MLFSAAKIKIETIIWFKKQLNFLDLIAFKLPGSYFSVKFQLNNIMIKLRLALLVLLISAAQLGFAQEKNIEKIVESTLPYPEFAIDRCLEAKVYCSYTVEDNSIRVIDVKSKDPVLSVYVFESLNNTPIFGYEKKSEEVYLVLDFKLK